MDKAPEGHLLTVAIISSEEAFATLIQGLAFVLKTRGKFLTQLPECAHLPDCHTTVTSLLEFFFYVVFIHDSNVF